MSDLDCGVRAVHVPEAVEVWQTILREANQSVLRDRLMGRVVNVLVMPHGDLAGADQPQHHAALARDGALLVHLPWTYSPT